MKDKIEELTAEIKKRDKVVAEWNDTLESVDNKIQSLETENAGLRKEKEELHLQIEHRDTHIRELENINERL